MYDGLIVFFGTDNMEETHKFYTEICGLKLYINQGGCRVYSIEGGGKIGFCRHVDSDAGDTIITLVTDNVEELFEKFIAVGIETDGKPRVTEKYGIYHFFTKDPDGHKVEIQKFLWDEYYSGKPE